MAGWQGREQAANVQLPVTLWMLAEVLPDRFKVDLCALGKCGAPISGMPAQRSKASPVSKP